MDIISTFLSKMGADGEIAQAAGQALAEYAEKHRDAIAPFTREIAGHLNSVNFGVRLYAASILCLANTEEAIRLYINKFADYSTGDLVKIYRGVGLDATFGSQYLSCAHCSCDVFNSFSTFESRPKQLHKTLVEFLDEVACKETGFPERTRSDAVLAMRAYLNNYYEDEDLDSHTFTPSFLESVKQVMNSENAYFAGEAMRLLAQISHRVQRVPRRRSLKPSAPRINVPATTSRAIISEYGPNRFRNLHPEDFEKLIGLLLRDAGYRVEETSYTGDFGADLLATRKSTGQVWAVQVKRYDVKSLVGVSDVNQVLGAREYYKAAKTLMITTSDYTKPARALAGRTGVKCWAWCSGPQNLDHLIVCSSAACGTGIRRSFDEQEAACFFSEFQGPRGVSGGAG